MNKFSALVLWTALGYLPSARTFPRSIQRTIPRLKANECCLVRFCCPSSFLFLPSTEYILEDDELTTPTSS
ncbi:hypothetical protein BDV30DRAFT_217024 [Aspergillus minisclerotigenes]|uniref:Secreted protein n=1 Tax=Aspergillus minisclerotigenes TaxID=656917 RepID=A0A5N6IST8_9EURO|nr:hypothetical protein BDV30DRAFT_217024 [Aspergillus minisclerotigenes]